MNYKVDRSIVDMIGAFSNAFGPSGFEDGTNAVARTYVNPDWDIHEDNIRNFYITSPKHRSGSKPMLLLDAHGDEVGMMVHSVKPNGTIRFVALGGWNLSSLTSTKVLVRNASAKK